MMAIAAGGNAAGDAPAGAAAGGDAPAGAAVGGDAVDEANVVANDAAGGAAEAPQVPQSPLVSPVREPTPERQPTPERPLSPPPSSPETEWVTYLYEEPVEFGPVPRPIGYVDPDDIEPIFFGPQPRPMDYVEPDFEKDLGTSKQVMGGAILKLVNRVKRLEKQAHLRRRKLVIADSDEEAEDAVAKEDDIDLDENTTLATAALGPEQPAVPTENVKPMEEQEEMEVPLTRKRSTYRCARTQFHTPAFAIFRSTISTGVPSPTIVPELAASYVAPDTAGPSVPADKGKAP
nr:hypothetical protein [Tanacetum cinerariifolium]